jgi:protein-tyrosine-phosphatase
MAASIASTFLPDVDVSSAGVEAWGQRASAKAIALMRRRYRVDLSPHRSTDLEQMDLGDFDFIVPMESRFANRLSEEFHVPINKLITWDIKDPAIDNTEAAYESCLSDIERWLPRILEVVRQKQQTGER